MTRVLAHHQKNRVSATSNAYNGRTLSPRPSAKAAGKGTTDKRPVADGDPAQPLAAAAYNLNSASLEISKLFDSPAPPEIESVSATTLMARSKAGDLAPSRRSLRRLQEHQYQEKDAELTLGLASIRKKLNFKSNVPADDERPRKRVKRDWIKCQCHLTIWDNRDRTNDIEPLVRKSRMCQVTATETASNGYFIDIELERAFNIRATDLKVSTERHGESVLSIIDNYFLEVKIIPTNTREDTVWPPIPVLGKSDGDHFAGLVKSVSEKLQGALVARYMHLPQAPAADVPLSVYFLHEGCTYRTKYGLEVNSWWARPDANGIRATQKESDTDDSVGSWAVDSSGYLFGRKRLTNNGALMSRASLNPHSLVQISYTVDAMPSKTVPKEFRQASVVGYQCPACPTVKLTDMQELQFHLLTCHIKYKFTPGVEIHDPISDDLTSVEFRVSVPDVVRKKNSLREDTSDWQWHRPSEAFDLPSFVNGDRTWVGEQPTKRGTGAHGSSSLVQDPATGIRNQNDGFLPAEYVRDFRKADRKKYPVIELLRHTDGKTSTYTSFSHRKTAPSEGYRSETDDEVDDEWYIERHLQDLDQLAEKEGWSDMRRELWKRWDRHRIEEKLEHPRFLSDSLVRFVRKERAWLACKDNALRMAWAQLLRDMKRTKAINEAVCVDLYRMIASHGRQGGDQNSKQQPEINGTMDVEMPEASPTLPRAEPHASTRAPQPNDDAATLAAKLEALLCLMPNHCGVCTKPILSFRKEGFRCCDDSCEASAVSYHAKCVRQRRSERLTWACAFCQVRKRAREGGKVQIDKGLRKGKGKGKVVD